MALHRRRTSVFAKIILRTRMIHHESRAMNYKGPYILPAAFAVFYFLRRIHRFLLRTTWTTKDMMLAGHILNDIVRIFEPIIRTDIRRAVWTWYYRRDSVDPLFARFTIITDAISQELSHSFLSRDLLGLRNLGDGLWRVSQVPRSPSPPPPPYSLFDLTSPTENFTLVYHPMPMLPPSAFPSFEDSAKSVFSLKRKRITDVSTDDSEDQRQRARQRRAPKNPAVRYDLRPRITDIA